MDNPITPGGDYWKTRIGEEESKAQKIAVHYSKHINKQYKNILTKINQSIDALYAQIQSDGVASVTRSQLWQYSRFIDLKNQIESECRGLAANQISLLEEELKKVFQMVIGEDIETYTGNNIHRLGKSALDYILKENWSGQHYSTRIWNNAGTFATRIENKITDMVVMGKSPDQLKKELISECGVSFRQADRLVRTETSYVFNQATIKRYQDMGIEEVEILREPDCCEVCAEYTDKYTLANKPMIPAHPNCRCCYIPVVNSIKN